VIDNKKVAIIDCDDVIMGFKKLMCEALNRHTGKTVHCEQWTTYNVIEFYDDLALDDFYKVIIENELLKKGEPNENVRETILKLKEMGYHIVIITSRAYHPNAEELTKQWMEKHRIPYDDIHVSGNGIKKSSCAKIYKNIEFVIDDNLDNLIDFEVNSNAKKLFLVDQPWNRNDTRYIRITNMNEIFNHL